MSRCEMDFTTHFTAVYDGDIDRGGGSLAARFNHVIQRALEAEGVKLKVTPGNAIPVACSTDVHRIEYVEDEGGEG